MKRSRFDALSAAHDLTHPSLSLCLLFERGRRRLAGVARAIGATGGRVETTAQQRQLLWHGSPVVTIDYEGPQRSPWRGKAHYRNLVWGYTLDLQSHEVTHGR